jgi:hypothetical protein
MARMQRALNVVTARAHTIHLTPERLSDCASGCLQTSQNVSSREVNLFSILTQECIHTYQLAHPVVVQQDFVEEVQSERHNDTKTSWKGVGNSSVKYRLLNFVLDRELEFPRANELDCRYPWIQTHGDSDKTQQKIINIDQAYKSFAIYVQSSREMHCTDGYKCHGYRWHANNLRWSNGNGCELVARLTSR